MPSDSIAGFLDQAQASRVLFPEQIEQLIRQPDIPESNLDLLCKYLEDRGALTRFQADMLRDGRGNELSFAGYPVIDDLGPCPGGRASRTLHPSLRTPLLLRRYREESLLPSDSSADLINRARSAASLQHPNLVTLIDASFHRDEAYATIDVPADSATLDELVRDIGPMPGFLAAEYGRQAASALRAAHERGLWHGDVRPANLLVGPMTSKTSADGMVRRRPAPNAAIKLADLGLVPIRPPAAAVPPAVEVLAYLPPERIDHGTYDARGDLYGLGATLYFLLSGRPPFSGKTPGDVIQKIRTSEPVPLATLRPDLPPELAAVVHQLLARESANRLPTAFDAELALAPFCRPGTAPAPAPAEALAAIPAAQPVEAAGDSGAFPSSAMEWGTTDPSTDFSTAHADSGPIRRQYTARDKTRSRMLMVLGLLLHLSAVALLVAWITGAFDSKPDPEPTPPPKKEQKKPRRPAEPAWIIPAADPRT